MKTLNEEMPSPLPKRARYNKNGDVDTMPLDYVEIIAGILPFCDFETLQLVRLANQKLLKMATMEMKKRTDKNTIIYNHSKGALGGFELYLRPDWTQEYTSLKHLVRHAVKIPMSAPFNKRTGALFDESEVLKYIMENGSARAEDEDNPVRDQRGKWEFEVSYAREQELTELLAERFPNLTMPMKTVNDLFLYFKACGWSGEVYQKQFLECKRYLLPLLTDVKVTGQAHVIAEHDMGGYVYKEALTFVTSDGAKYELVGIDSDYELD